jgi:UDP-N-acetylglucosamine/UDP-N-acetylgalactosamine diphosphorylase
MRLSTLYKNLQKYSQDHILRLLESGDEKLLAQCEEIHWNVLEKQLQAIHGHTKHEHVEFWQPKQQPTYSHPAHEMKKKVLGCIIMAGGMGSRLCVDYPKALLPASPILEKTLLQIFIEKAQAFQKSYHSEVLLGIMTSKDTDSLIREYLHRNSYFGFDSKNICIFQQSSLPFLDTTGRILLDDETIVFGPDGNGSIFAAFAASSFLDAWEKRNVEAFSIIPIDNPLIDPFHPSLVVPVLNGCQMTVAAVRRLHNHEAVGVFGIQNSKVRVVEYSEITNPAGDEAFANISCFVTNCAFARKAARHRLPLHVAQKKYKGIPIYKCEYFIFDHLPKAQNVVVIPLERQIYFSPIKNSSGADSLATAQKAILARDMKRFEEITGKKASRPIELPQTAFYPPFSGFPSEFLAFLEQMA